MALSFVVCAHVQGGATPLHLAVLGGKLECARLLLDRGADKEAKGTMVRAPTATRYNGAWHVWCFVDWSLTK